MSEIKKVGKSLKSKKRKIMAKNVNMEALVAGFTVLCAKTGVTPEEVLAAMAGNAGANAGKEDAKEGGNTITLRRKCTITTEWPEKCEYKEGKISMKGVEMIGNGYATDVIVGMKPVKNYLTEVLMSAFGVSPFNERLYVGGRPGKDARKDAERMAGWAVSKHWSGAVKELLDGLRTVSASKQEDYIRDFVQDHAELITTIRQWNSVKWLTTKTGKAKKAKLKKAFEGYESVLNVEKAQAA